MAVKIVISGVFRGVLQDGKSFSGEIRGGTNWTNGSVVKAMIVASRSSFMR